MLIQVKDLVKSYQSAELETQVLHGLTFNITKGEFVSIMGPSGSGKSTLMHILGLLDRPTSGSYKLNNREVSSLSDDELARFRNENIGFVFQAFNLLPRTTVLENVELPLFYSADRRDISERAKKVLEKVGLGHRLNYFSNQISGGEKQRVAIARALVNDPAVIFADEPTGNLDSKSGSQIMALLQDLHEQGRTIILVTHETATAEHANRIIHIKDGLILSDKPVLNRRFAARDGSLLK